VNEERIDTTPNRSAEYEADAVLVQRALSGDAEAFATLFEVHKGRVYAVCLRMTNNPADADDLTQEAFIQAFRKLATFRGESALSTWLHRVAVNTTLMHFRRQPRTRTSLDDSTDQESSKREFGKQDDKLKHSLDRITLIRALEALPSGYRTIFELHEIGGYGHREIAKLLRCSIGNSKSQLHKAKQRIRECLVSRRHFSRHLQRAAVKAVKKEESARQASSARTSVTKQIGSKAAGRPVIQGSLEQTLAHEARTSYLLTSSHKDLAETSA
jgi:RNA polymerase sigma-70 factor (ECF subfamily)